MDSIDSVPQQQLKFYHYVGDFFNILKAFIGTNYQALPFAFRNSGIVLGVIGVFVIATLTNHCCHLMVRCKYYAINNIMNAEERSGRLSAQDLRLLRKKLSRALGYGDIGKQLFGNWAYHLIQGLVFFTQFCTAVAYFIFIGNTVYELFPIYTDFFNTTDPKPVNGSLDIPFILSEVSLVVTKDETLPPLQNSTFHTTTPPTTTPFFPLSNSFPVYSEAPDLRLVVLFPLGFFIVTSLIRKVRWLAPFSTIATIALFIGAVSLFGYICTDFTVDRHYKLVNWGTLPLFIGQLISAYEGIGCIIPIESSMEGNRGVFPAFMCAAIYVVFVILCAFGIFGYLRYGEHVSQLIVLNIPQQTPFSTFIDITLVISVLFTYPLQAFPAIEIAESYLLAPGKIFGSKVRHQYQYEVIDEEIPPNVTHSEVTRLLRDPGLETSLNTSTSSSSIAEVPVWRRNVVRVLLTFSIVGCAIVLRNSFAYLSAFTGAVGATLLAFVIPCATHLKVKGNRLSWKNVVKDWVIIIVSIICSVLTIIVIIKGIVQGSLAM